jgi:hypothetical protein
MNRTGCRRPLRLPDCCQIRKHAVLCLPLDCAPAVLRRVLHPGRGGHADPLVHKLPAGIHWYACSNQYLDVRLAGNACHAPAVHQECASDGRCWGINALVRGGMWPLACGQPSFGTKRPPIQIRPPRPEGLNRSRGVRSVAPESLSDLQQVFGAKRGATARAAHPPPAPRRPGHCPCRAASARADPAALRPQARNLRGYLLDGHYGSGRNVNGVALPEQVRPPGSFRGRHGHGAHRWVHCHRRTDREGV